MKKKSPQWIPPADLDKECLELCVAMNKLPGIATTNSCCGHGDHAFWIFFAVDEPEQLLPLLYWMQKCHTNVKGKWHVEAYTDCAGERVFWLLEGPVGTVAYEDAREIAQKLEGVANIRRLERKSRAR